MHRLYLLLVAPIHSKGWESISTNLARKLWNAENDLSGRRFEIHPCGDSLHSCPLSHSRLLQRRTLQWRRLRGIERKMRSAFHSGCWSIFGLYQAVNMLSERLEVGFAIGNLPQQFRVLEQAWLQFRQMYERHFRHPWTPECRVWILGVFRVSLWQVSSCHW